MYRINLAAYRRGGTLIFEDRWMRRAGDNVSRYARPILGEDNTVFPRYTRGRRTRYELTQSERSSSMHATVACSMGDDGGHVNPIHR